MDNPENLATLGTQAQDDDNQNKNITQKSKKIDVFSIYMQGASNKVTRVTLGVRWAHGRTLPLILVEEPGVPGENQRPDANH